MKRSSRKDIMEQVQEIFQKRGEKALEIARQQILQEKVECTEVREALEYFMTQYWQDLARPTLLSLACEAVGGDPDIMIPIATSMILISGGIDIHDDIIDQSETKWSRPTVLGKFGRDIALLVGDALLFKGLTLLNEVAEKGAASEKILMAIDIIRKMFFELGDAEGLEFQFRRRLDVSPEEYLRVVKKKAADVEAHTRISAILGGGTEDEVEALSNYGRLLGTLIILRDDFLDTIDTIEAQHRIKNECLPLPILYALENQESKAEIASILLKETITENDVELISKITHKAGGFKRFQQLMRKLAKDASLCLDSLKYNRKYLELLVQSLLPLQ